MREIKFRAWDKEYNFMYKVMRVAFENGTIYAWREALPGEFAMHIGRSVGKEAELMQYTGLKDKNGKEIYEGDITDKYGYIITWVDSSDSSNLGMPIGWYEQRDNFESYRQLEVGDEIEVIGNMYEHPELLVR